MENADLGGSCPRVQIVDSSERMGNYVKHFLQRYEGEVALAWSEWAWTSGPLPRDKVL